MKYIVCLLFAVSIALGAQAGKKPKATIKLVEATSQATRPGIPGGNTPTDCRIYIVWNATTYPETFFWRGEKGWLTCNMEKAHKAKGPKGKWTTTAVVNDAVHKGDTLYLHPVTGGRFPTPAEVPASARNTLYYKTAGSGWLSFKVQKITRLGDKLAE